MSKPGATLTIPIEDGVAASASVGRTVSAGLCRPDWCPSQSDRVVWIRGDGPKGNEMTTRFGLTLASAALLVATMFAQDRTARTARSDGAITTFAFETLASRNPGFDRTAYVYPEAHDLAGQNNPNVGDIRLDGIVIDAVTHTPAELQLVTSARIILDDAVDERRGGANIATGYGIGADTDTWIDEGNGSVTPTADDVAAAHGNFNLTSISAVRENVGTVSYELRFAQPTDTVLLWERGSTGDVLVDAVDDGGTVVGTLLVLDGVNDGDAVSTYTPTGLVVTTYVEDDFLNHGQELGSVGLRLPQAVPTVRFTAYQEAEGDGAVRYNGPDLKVIALAPQ